MLTCRQGIPPQVLFSFQAGPQAEPEIHVPIKSEGVQWMTVDGRRYLSLRGAPPSSLILALPQSPRAFTTLQISAATQGRQRLSIQHADGTRRQISDRNSWVNQKWDLTSKRSPGKMDELVLETVESPKPEGILVERLRVVDFPPISQFPAIDVFGIGILILLLIALSFREKRVYGICLGAFAALVFALRQGLMGPASPWWMLGGLITVLLWRHSRAPASEKARRRSELLWIPLSIGVILRWGGLAASAGAGLDFSDAEQYRNLALAFDVRQPFATSFREPMIVWAHWVVLHLFGDATIHIRVSTTIFSLLSIAMTYVLVFRITQRASSALVASLGVSINDLLVQNAALGGRNDLFVLLLVTFFWLALDRTVVSWKHDALLGVLAGAIGLTWLIGLISCSLVYLWRWNASGRRGVDLAAFAAPIALMIAPQLLYQWRTHGDALYSINFTTSYYEALANHQLSPQVERLSWTHYLTQGMGLLRLGMNLVIGYGSLLFNPLERYNKVLLGFHYTTAYSYFLFGFLIVGIGLDIIRYRAIGLFLLVASLHLSAAFVRVTPHPRLFMHAVPLFAYFCSLPMAALGAWFYEWAHCKVSRISL